MAKKTNLSSSDSFNFDMNLDDGGMDWSTSKPKKGRSAILELGKITAKASLKGATDASFLRQSTKAVFPKGIGTAIDYTDEAATSLRSLYNSTSSQIRPLVADIKRTTQRVLPAFEEHLPKKVADALKNWSKPEETAEYQQQNAREAQIGQANAEIFAFEFKQRQKDRTMKQARDEIKESIEQSRFVLQAKQLNTISMSVQQMADYQATVGINYQKKALELQFRQYFTQRDTHEEQKRQGAILENALKILVHNTGLPDYEKLTEKNRVGGFLRNQFATKAVGTVFDKRFGFINKVHGVLEKRINARLGSLTAGFGMGLSGAEMAVDAYHQNAQMSKDMAEMGGDPDMGLKGMVADAGGEYGTQYLLKKLHPKLKAYLAKHPEITKNSNKLQYFLQNLPGFAGRFANSRWGEDNLMGGAVRWGKGVLNESLMPDSPTLHKSDYATQQHAATWTNQASKSITEIIPGYLARILQELQMTRTKKNVGLTTFDLKANKFTSKDDMERNAMKGVFSDFGQRNMRSVADDLVKQVDPKGQLSPEEARILKRQLLRINLSKDNVADKRTMQAHYTYDGEARPHAEKFSKLFGDMYGDDHDFEKHKQFTGDFQQLGYGVEERFAYIQNMINAGVVEPLIRAGIVDKDGTTINRGKLYSLHLEDDPVVAAMGTAPTETANPAQRGRRRNRNRNRSRRGVKTMYESGPAFPNPMKHMSLRRGQVVKPQRMEMDVPFMDEDARMQASGLRSDGYSNLANPVKGRTKAVPEIVDTLVESIKAATTRIKTTASTTVKNLKRSVGGTTEEGTIHTMQETLHGDLVRIEGLLEKGIGVRRRGGVIEDDPESEGTGKKFFDRSLKEHFQMGRDAVVGGARRAYASATDGVPGIWSKGKDRVSEQSQKWWKWGKEKAQQGWEKFEDTKDVYLNGEKYPKLLRAKLLAGEYLDAATKLPIKSWKEIRGAIIDKSTGEEVLSMMNFREAYVRSGVKQKFLSAFGATMKFGKEMAGRVSSGVQGIHASMIAMAHKAIQMTKDYLDGPQDVYVAPDFTKPVMLKRIFAAGGYHLDVEGSPVIMKVTEISGQVKDNMGNVVLTQADLMAGIFDKFGRSLKTGWKRGVQIVKDVLHSSFKGVRDKVTTALNQVKKAGAAAGGYVKDQAKSFQQWIAFDGVMISGGKTIVERLTQIRDLLNSKLSGNGKGPKKRYDDKDGDGIRDGSYADQQKQKKAHHEEELKEHEEAALEHIDKDEKLMVKALGAMSASLGKIKGGAAGAGSWIDKLIGSGEGALAEKVLGKLGMGKLAGRLKGAGKRGLGGLLKRVGLKGIGGRLAGAGAGLAEGAAGLGGAAVEAGGAAASAIGGAAATGAAGLAGAAAKAGGKGAFGRIGASIGKRGLIKGLAGRGSWELAKAGAKLGAIGIPKALWRAGKFLVTARKRAGPLGFLLGGAGDMVGGLALDAVVGIGGMLALPVLGAAAVGGLAYGGYKLFKHFQNGRDLDAVTAMRYAQYGFLPNDTDHREAVFGLEGALAKNIKFSGSGMANVDQKELVKGDIFKPFGVDRKNKEQVRQWATWYMDRFKPVYMTHLTVYHKLSNGKTDLSGVSQLKAEQKKAYLEGAKFSGGPYSEMVTPFIADKQLAAGPKEVADAVKKAMDSLTADKPSGKEADQSKLKAAVAGGVAGTAAGLKGGKGAMPAPMGAKAAGGNTTVAAAGKAAVIAGTAAAGVMSSKGTLDPLSIVRYKTYGLTSMDTGKIQNLLALATAVGPNLKVTRVKSEAAKAASTARQVTYTGNPATVAMRMAPMFGATSPEDQAAWSRWFLARFLPAHLAYLGALYSQADLESESSALAKIANDPAKLILVAQATASAMIDHNYAPDAQSASIWLVSSTPWPGYTLSGDMNSIRENVEALKKKAPEGTVKETKAKVVAPKKPDTPIVKKDGDVFGRIGKSFSDLGSKISEKFTSFKAAAGDKLSKLGTGLSKAGSMVGNRLASMGASAASGISSAASSVGSAVGGTVAAIGKGLGGLAAKLPDPTSQNWAGVKAMMEGVGKMTGVDPALMGTMAAIESGFKWNAKAGTSSAAGLFQFISSTWNNMLKQFGSKYGIPPGTPSTDPKASALMGAEYIKQNAAILSKSIKRPLTSTDIYAAHFLGPAGAVKLLTADPSANAVQMMPGPAKANANIFTERGAPRTVGQVIQYLNTLVSNRGKQFGVSGGGAASPVGTGNAKTDAPAAGGSSAGAAIATGAAPTSGSKAPADAMAQARATSSPAPSSGGASPVPVADHSPGVPGSGGFSSGAGTSMSPARPQQQAAEPTKDMSGVHEEQLDTMKSVKDLLAQLVTIVAKGNGMGAPAAPTAGGAAATSAAQDLPRGSVSMSKKSYAS